MTYLTNKHINATPKKRVPFNATDMSKKTTPLIEHKLPDTPTVYFTPVAWNKVLRIVAKSSGEVGWLGLVEQIDEDYMITDVFVPVQEVTGVTTDIEAAAHAALVFQLDQAGYDVNQLLYWGHSHVNMSVSPSVTDEEQLAEYIEHMETATFFLRGIHNKRGEVKMDVFDVGNNVLHQRVDVRPWIEPLTKEQLDDIDTQLAENVKRRAQPVYGYGGARNPDFFHRNNYNSNIVASASNANGNVANSETIITAGDLVQQDINAAAELVDEYADDLLKDFEPEEGALIMERDELGEEHVVFRPFITFTEYEDTIVVDYMLQQFANHGVDFLDAISALTMTDEKPEVLMELFNINHGEAVRYISRALSQ